MITLEINDLKGNIHCYAESDENFPETYTQKKNNFMQVFDAAIKNPQLGEVFFNGANLAMLKEMSGLSVYIPQEEAYKKQLGEIDIMLKSGPVPNPALLQAQQQLKMGMMKVQQLQQHPGMDVAQLDPAIAELQQLEQAIQTMPPEICSLPIDAQVDDNVIEAATCWMWMNSEDGRKIKNQNPPAFTNIRMHFLDHEQAAAAKAAQMGAGAGKPPSVSIGYKDVAALDKGASDQILAKAGVSPTPGGPGMPGAPAPTPGPPPGPSKPPASPIPAGAPENAGGPPKQ